MEGILRGRDMGELEGGENIIRIYWMRKESISIKENK